MEIGKLRLGVGETLAALAFVIGSGITWSSAASFSGSPDFTPIALFVGLVLAAVSFGVLALTNAVNPWVVRGLLFFGFLLAVPLAFLNSMYLGLPAALLAGLLAEAGLWRAKHIRNILRTPMIGFTVRRALPLYFSGVSVVLTAILFLSPLGEDTLANPVPEPVIRQSVKLADPVIRPLVGYSVQGQIDDILASAIENQLPAGETADQRLIDVQRERYSERYGIPIAGEDTVADVIAKLLDKQLLKIEDRIEQYYKIGFFLAAFFVFQLVSLPFTWVTTTLLFAAIGLLRMVKVLRVKTSRRPVRVLRWADDGSEKPKSREPAEKTSDAPNQT